MSMEMKKVAYFLHIRQLQNRGCFFISAYYIMGS